MRTVLVSAWFATVWLRPFVSEAVTPQFHWVLHVALIGLSLELCWLLPAPSRPAPRPLSFALSAWVLVSLLVLVRANALLPAAATWLNVVAPAIVATVVWRLQPAEVRRLISGLVLGGLLIGAFGLLQYFVILPQLTALPPLSDAAQAVQEVAARRRVLGTFPLPNLLGGYLTMVLPLGVGVWRASGLNRAQQLIAGASLLVMSVVFVLAQSLGATAALFGACAVVLLVSRLPRPGRRWAILVGTGALVLGSVVLARPALRQFSDVHNPFSNRLTYWQVAASVIREHPIVGVGLGRFEERYAAQRSAQTRRVIHAHNSYLELWAELGVFGVLAWLGVVASGLRAAHRRAGWLAVAGWAFVLHNLVDFSLYEPQVSVLWWLVLGLSLRSSPASDTRAASHD